MFEDFCEYESANGGSFFEYAPGKRQYIKSILHGIGLVVLNHFKAIGLLGEDRVGVPTPMPKGRTPSVSDALRKSILDTVVDEVEMEICPECGNKTLQRNEGCSRCTHPDCTYYKCG